MLWHSCKTILAVCLFVVGGGAVVVVVVVVGGGGGCCLLWPFLYVAVASVATVSRCYTKLYVAVVAFVCCYSLLLFFFLLLL